VGDPGQAPAISPPPVVVLGVSGGIAAYKSVEVARRLVDAGVHVVPVMTKTATRFIGEATLSALCSEPVRRGLFSEDDPIPHTSLARRADLVLVVPATARLIACYAAGIADGLLLSTLLATRVPVLLCPAMHTEMWEHPALVANLATLESRGVKVLAPEEGRLAGGDFGAGRLASVERIVDAALSMVGLAASGQPVKGGGRPMDMTGLTVLVSAGGTREPIDPVRVITNRSSGRQGYAIAQAAYERGAEVVLVSAASLEPPRGVRLVEVETAADMEREMLAHAPSADVVVMAAAVADFRPKSPSTTKILKADGLPEIVLEPTPDILAELARRRRGGQVLVGFAAETGEPVGRARTKLVSKGVDLMVANDVSAPGRGFDGETNAVTIIGAGGLEVEVPLTTKRQVAEAVLDNVVDLVRRHGGPPRSDT